MKKLLLIAIALSTSLGLVACGNEDNSPKKPKQDVKTEQQKTKKSQSSPKKDHAVTDKNTSNQAETSTSKQPTSTSNEPTTEKTAADATTTNSNNSEQTATPAAQPVHSQRDETNGRGDVVNSASQAITTLSNGLGNNSDFAYTLLSTENHMYEIQVTSKSIKAQGGSGTIGIYDVMEDGTYFLRP